MPIQSLKQYLLRQPRFLKRFAAICFDILLCAFTVWLAFGLRVDEWGEFHGAHWVVLICAVGFSTPLFISFGLYRAILRYVGSVALASMTRVFITYTFLFLLVFTVIGVDGVPRSIGLIQPILLFIGIGYSRYFVRYWLGGIDAPKVIIHKPITKAIIYGAGAAGRQLAAALSVNRNILVKGFFDDDLRLHGNTINGLMVYGSENIKSVIEKLGITDILLAIPSASQSRRNEIIAGLNGCGVRVRTLPGVHDMASGRVRVSDLHDLDMNDLLGRKVVPPNSFLLEKNIRNKVVLITGAGGSIGGELCRQIINFSPKLLVLIENSEHALYLIERELKGLIINDVLNNNPDFDGTKPLISDSKSASLNIVSCLASVRDEELILKIFSEYQPNTVFHAAAYKHVPLVESNPSEGLKNNIFGTLICAQASLKNNVSCFTLVSTDKAVRPTNIMGASKRIAELVLQSMAEIAISRGYATNFSMVRFGNVLGSSGSVAPLFSAQIAAGGPITLTHPEVTRYFMTIPEAAQLVIQASAMATGGDVFVLDMGDAVRIYDLAVKMIYLSGLLVKDKEHPHGDIEIVITGLRPGEKLYEELLIGDNPQPTAHPKIMKAHEDFISWDHLQQELEKLNKALDSCDNKMIRAMLKKLVPGYHPNEESVDLDVEIFS